MPQLTDAQVRFRRLLTQTCTIERASVTTGTDMDLVLGTLATVGTGVLCLFEALHTSADMQAVGPMERDVQQLFVLPDQSLSRHDVVTDADGVKWIVTGVPQVFSQRGVAHHCEATVEKQAVQ